MHATNKNKITVLLFLVAFITFGVAAYDPPKSSKQGEYKNLQILPKDISKDSLDAIMDGFKKALGVKCTFCHVHTGDDFTKGWDMASDDKMEKGVARHMMKMTSAINTNFFNFDNSNMPDTIRTVTCMTCHRGIAHPDKEGIEEQMMGNDTLKKMQAPPPSPPAPKN